MTHHGVQRIAGSLLIATVLAGCISPVIPTSTSVPVTVEPTWQPTPAMLPTEAIPIKIVDGSQGSVMSPVHGQLLVRACEKEAYDKCPSAYECDLGYVDLANAHFVRVQHISEEDPFCESRKTDLIWAPDGTQFVYRRGWIGSIDFIVYGADGTQKQPLGSFYLSGAFWTPDGRYLIVKTGVGPNSQPAVEYTVYDALSWKKVCVVASGNGMIFVVGGQCIVPLKDGRAVFLSGTKGVEMAICNDQANCPGSNKLRPIGSFSDQTFDSTRYQAQIENYWLRVFDSESGVARTYVIPGYRVTSIAWSPK